MSSAFDHENDMSQGNMDVNKVSTARTGSEPLKAGELVKDQNGYEFAGNGSVSVRQATHRILDIENEQEGHEPLPQQGPERDALDSAAAQKLLGSSQNGLLSAHLGGNIDANIPSAAAVGGQSRKSTLLADNDSLSSLKQMVHAAGPSMDAYKKRMMQAAPSTFGQTNSAIGAVPHNGGLQLPVEEDLQLLYAAPESSFCP